MLLRKKSGDFLHNLMEVFGHLREVPFLHVLKRLLRRFELLFQLPQTVQEVNRVLFVVNNLSEHHLRAIVHRSRIKEVLTDRSLGYDRWRLILRIYFGIEEMLEIARA